MLCCSSCLAEDIQLPTKVKEAMQMQVSYAPAMVLVMAGL